MINDLKIGLALGSGGARGLCHIGVLEVFEREGFVPDYITGCSMGAIAASLYAADVSCEQMVKMSQAMRTLSIADVGVNPYSTLGLAKGDKSVKMLKKMFGDKTFADCKIPLAVTAADLVKGNLVTFKSGPLWRAVRASYAIPALFRPVVLGKLVLVDGGLLERIPITECRALGADVVVAVDALGPIKEESELPNILSVIERSILLFDDAVNNNKIIEEADYVITPDIGSRSVLRFGNNDPTIEAGRRAAEEALPKIYEFLESFTKEKIKKKQESTSIRRIEKK